ncbi:MAG: hypothetical protein WDO56_25830 [Gammaproteobacteria bacterium]
MSGPPPSGWQGRFESAGDGHGDGIAAQAAGLGAREVDMMWIGVGALYLVIGALFATIVVPLLAMAAMATVLLGFVWILL